MIDKFKNRMENRIKYFKLYNNLITFYSYLLEHNEYQKNVTRSLFNYFVFIFFKEEILYLDKVVKKNIEELLFSNSKKVLLKLEKLFNLKNFYAMELERNRIPISGGHLFEKNIDKYDEIYERIKYKILEKIENENEFDNIIKEMYRHVKYELYYFFREQKSSSLNVNWFIVKNISKIYKIFMEKNVNLNFLNEIGEK